MNADALLCLAQKYRTLARGINDEKTIAILEHMASETERRARSLQVSPQPPSLVPRSFSFG
jgi:hypothetical protein